MSRAERRKMIVQGISGGSDPGGLPVIPVIGNSAPQYWMPAPKPRRTTRRARQRQYFDQFYGPHRNQSN